MLLDGRDEARWETAAMGQISDEPDRYQPKLLVLLCAQPDHAGYLGRLPESGQSIPAPSRLGWVVLRRSAFEPAFAEIVFGLWLELADSRQTAFEHKILDYGQSDSQSSFSPTVRMMGQL
jgi:hypothetical protein